MRDDSWSRLRADAVLIEVDLRPELARHLALHQCKAGALPKPLRHVIFQPTVTLSRHAQIQHMILKKGILYEQNPLHGRGDVDVLAQLATQSQFHLIKKATKP